MSHFSVESLSKLFADMILFIKNKLKMKNHNSTPQIGNGLFQLMRMDKSTRHFGPSQSVGGRKTGDPREKPPEHPQAELSLPELGPNPQR